MKKFHNFGLIASFVLALSSCTKSTSDLITNQEIERVIIESAKKTNHSGLLNGNNHSGNPLTSELISFYPNIIQPSDIQLGNGSIIEAGNVAVFYIRLAPEAADLFSSYATLTTIDNSTGLPLETYNLISYKDVGTVDALVPAELKGTPFMVALVKLGDVYIGKSISLSAEVELNFLLNKTTFDNAFSVE